MLVCSPLSEIAFSQVREDPLIEWQLVQQLAEKQDHPLRMLLVASGGCTALSLLASPAIAQIDAVDLNPAQLHLVELKRTALQSLSWPEQWRLFGPEHSDTSLKESWVESPVGVSRLQIYQALRPYLPESTREFWDARLDQIAFGPNRVGRFEQLFRQLAAHFAAIDVDPVHQPHRAIHHPQWSAIFETVFERGKLVEMFGEAAVNYSMDRSFGEHFADVFAQALQRFLPTENYFLTQVWCDRYATGPDGTPPYLQPSGQQMIIHLGTERLKLHLGAFSETLCQLAATAPYDLIQFSNISDWMPIPALHEMLSTATSCLQPGGFLVGRRLNEDHQLATLMAEHLPVDQALSAQLLNRDRSFFYREVVVGVKA